MDSEKQYTYQEFKKNCSEFFNMTHDRTACTPRQAENGQKTVGILWLNRTDDWTDIQIYQSEIILNLVDKRVMEVYYANLLNMEKEHAESLH